MDNSIRAGDLVCVVRCCCVKNVRTPVFVASKITDWGLDGNAYCNFCGADYPAEMNAEDAHEYTYPLSWLKKIPPLVEPESIVERDTVKA